VFTEGFGQLDETSIPLVLADGPQLTLAPDPTSASTARAFVRANTLDSDEDVRDNAELLVSELVTNGVLHAGTSMTVGIVARERSVLLGVSDRSEVLPTERLPSLSAEGGRGIAMMTLVARHWGVAARETGKIIWCLIDAAPVAP
jgi:anti-sigma regulatory factor (Ser/Thr protein kinase)